MSFVDKAKAKAEEVMGEVKEAFGEAYGNDALVVDGELEADAAREREAQLDAAGEREAEPDAGDTPREGA